MLLLLLAAQVATPAAAPTAPQPVAFSILQPVPDEPCVAKGKKADPGDIVVCGKPLPSQALPIYTPAERRGANPDMTGVGAMNAEGTPCGARSGGCQVGVDIFGAGTAAVRMAQKLVAPDSCCERPGESTNAFLLGKDVVNGIARAFRKKPDKSERVAIPLDDTPPKSVILP